MFEKRGISPLIATVLIIGFVVTIAAIIFFWGKNYIVETAEKEGELARIKLLCTNVNFDVVSLDNGVLELENKGEVEIENFKIRSDSDVVDLNKGLPKLGLGNFNLADVGLSGLSTFDLIPMLKPVGRGAQLIPCSNKIKSIG